MIIRDRPVEGEGEKEGKGRKARVTEEVAEGRSLRVVRTKKGKRGQEKEER